MMTTNHEDSIQNDSFLQEGLHNKQVTPNAMTAPIDTHNGTVANDIESNDIESNDIESNDIRSNDIRSNDIRSNDIDKSNHNVGHLELLEERPVINKERLDVGKVTVTKHARTKTIDVPIELVEEYITIRTEYHDAKSQDLLSGNYDEKDILRHVEPSLDSKAVVTVNGKQIEIGDEPIEIVLSRQVATITKDTYAIQEIDINKTTHTHTDNIQVVLKHEELDVKEEGFLAHESSTTPGK